MSKKKLKQHLEFTPWWRSKEAFDFLNMKPWDKFNQQAVIHPSTRSPVTDLCKIVMGKPSTCRPLIQIITCFIIYQNSIPLKTTTKRCYFCTFSFLLLITRLTRDARRLDWIIHHRQTKEGKQEVESSTNPDELSHLGGHVIEGFNLPLNQLWTRPNAVACVHYTKNFRKVRHSCPIWGKNRHRH